jgi:hypothetical protein
MMPKSLCDGCTNDCLNLSIVTFKVNEFKPWIWE